MKIKCTAALLMLVGSLSVNANDLVASVEHSKNGNSSVVGLDLISDGNVAGFSFALEISGLEGKFNSKGCVSDLPKGFSANCAFSNGKLYVIASSDQPGVTLPKGLVSVGSIAVTGMKKGAVKVVGFETSNDQGVSTQGSSKVENM